MNYRFLILVGAVSFYLAVSARADDCDEMEVLDVAMGMCMPIPMTGMPMQMLMLHGNGFAVETVEPGPRGRSAISSPNMFMADIGTSFGDSQYLNLDYMGTLERWTMWDL